MRSVSKSATFLATESVNSAPFKRGETEVQIFWQGIAQNSSSILRCTFLARRSAKLIANFSATMVTSLPSFSLSLSLSLYLSLSPNVPHAQYRKRFRASYNTGGEQIQGNETRNVRDRGPRLAYSANTGEGGWASWTAQALFAWTRTNDEPGKSGTFGYIAAGLLCADVSFTHRALARFWAVGAKAAHGNKRLLDACFRVFARCAKKKIFNSFTSFSRWKWFIFSLSISGNLVERLSF